MVKGRLMLLRIFITAESTATSATGGDSSCPSLQYSLYYDIQRNSLAVNLGQAFNLPSKTKSGSSDTSVILYMQPNKAEVFESKLVRRDLNPIFDQTFEFTGLLGVQVARKQTLIFKVYGRSRCVLVEIYNSAVEPLYKGHLRSSNILLLVG